MKIKNPQAVSDLISKGRKAQKINQTEAANILEISRTKLAMMEVSGEALGSASFFSVLKAIKLAGLELYLEVKPSAPTLNDIQKSNAIRNMKKIEAEDAEGVSSQ